MDELDPFIKGMFFLASAVAFGIGAFRPIDRTKRFCTLHMACIGWLFFVCPLVWNAFAGPNPT